jgi:tyrosyl-tRNA synthetase
MDIEQQVQQLMLGTEYGNEQIQLVMQAELRQRLLEAQQDDRPLRVYGGFDPRTADLHLGHTIIMRKLRQFQDLGHEVTFLIGTFTSLIGDPHDKDTLRPRLTPQQVEHNARTYAEQAFRILDPAKTRLRYNNEWLAKLSFAQLIELASHFTVQQFLARENFKLRWESGQAIHLHETFYALMQGFDAHTLRADVQVGGTDQFFGIVTASRKIMTALGGRPNIAIIMKILPGLDGETKMSKSLGNHIPLNSGPEDMFGKVMSLPDHAMAPFARLATRWTPAQIEELEHELASGRLHPRDLKMQLAGEITAFYYSDAEAEQAQDAFVQVFQRGQAPADLPEYKPAPGESLVDVLVNAGLAASKSEARRLVLQNGVRLNGETLHDPEKGIPSPGMLQAGKRRFIRIR